VTRDRRVDLLLLGVAVVWGSSYLAAKVLLDVVGVLPLLALRYAGAAVALAAVVAVTRARLGREELRCGVLLGLSQAAILALETYGVAGTSATNAGLLISLTILLTPGFEGIVRRSWLPPAFFAAALVAVVGVALLVSASGGRLAFRVPTHGDLLVLAAAVVRAAHVTAIGRVTRTRDLDLRGLTFVQTALGAVLFTVLDPGGVSRAVTHASPGQWAGIAYLALGCSVFAFLAQSWAVHRTSAARASLLLGTEPLFAVLVGVLLGGELLRPLGALGAVLILAGTAWGQRVERLARVRTAVPEPPPGPHPVVAADGPRPTTGRA
jgi:drug/metabolite transporter (DMT)-like permease